MMSDTMRVEIKQGWAVYDGRQHRTGGEVVEVDLERGEHWVARGWARKVDAPAPAEPATPRPSTGTTKPKPN